MAASTRPGRKGVWRNARAVRREDGARDGGRDTGVAIWLAVRHQREAGYAG